MLLLVVLTLLSEKQGGSRPLYKSLDNPSYTITSGNTNIGMAINNSSCTESNSRRARSADADIGESANTITGREIQRLEVMQVTE